MVPIFPVISGVHFINSVQRQIDGATDNDRNQAITLETLVARCVNTAITLETLVGRCVNTAITLETLVARCVNTLTTLYLL